MPVMPNSFDVSWSLFSPAVSLGSIYFIYQRGVGFHTDKREKSIRVVEDGE